MKSSAMQEMVEQVIELVRYYALWWFFMEKSNAVRYDRTERNYPDFFITVADSLRCSFFATAYRLFDKRSDVRSLDSLIRAVEYFDEPLASSLQKKADSITPIVKKIILLRHK